MKKLHGIGVSGGIAMGRIQRYQSAEPETEKRTVEDTQNELTRFETAQKEAIAEINQIYLESLKQIGEKDSMIFKIHIMMLQDEDFSDAIREKIKGEKVAAEYAVWKIGQEFSEQFAQMDSEYMQNRKADVIDIACRLVQCLTLKEEAAPVEGKEPFILAAEDLTPSETMQMNKSNVLAILTREGSRTSHASILARTMGIPAVACLSEGFEELEDGTFAAVNGASGDVILDPDESIRKEFQQKDREHWANQLELKRMQKSPAVTKSGRAVEVNANIGHPDDVDLALENGADGIGLFRSEFLYLERSSLPTEEEQFQAYRSVLEKMGEKPVIIRTFDIGADKQVPYLNLPQEANPALGYRAIRICLEQKDLFRTQLRALLRASAFGNLKIMFPMIISLEEVKAARGIMEEAKSELKAESVAFAANLKTGIMIETPSAAVLSGELAKECDFFSIGTNDLTQYTLAVDRMNGATAKLYDQRNAAVLKMIQTTAESAHQVGIPVGICGESASDLFLTEFYLNVGIDELSVAPSSVLELKKAICNL